MKKYGAKVQLSGLIFYHKKNYMYYFYLYKHFKDLSQVYYFSDSHYQNVLKPGQPIYLDKKCKIRLKT